MEEQKQSKIISSAILLRRLSLKSKLGFGDNSHLTVEDVIKSGRQADLVWAYYNLSMISFLDEVLVTIGIKENERIDKPGKDSSFGEEIVKRVEANSLEKALTDNKNNFINNFNEQGK